MRQRRPRLALVLQVLAGQPDAQRFGLSQQRVERAPKSVDPGLQMLCRTVATAGMHDHRKAAKFGKRLEARSHRRDGLGPHVIVKRRQIDAQVGVNRARPDAVPVEDAAAIAGRLVVRQVLGAEEFALGEASGGKFGNDPVKGHTVGPQGGGQAVDGHRLSPPVARIAEVAVNRTV